MGVQVETADDSAPSRRVRSRRIARHMAPGPGTRRVMADGDLPGASLRGTFLTGNRGDGRHHRVLCSATGGVEPTPPDQVDRRDGPTVSPQDREGRSPPDTRTAARRRPSHFIAPGNRAESTTAPQRPVGRDLRAVGGRARRPSRADGADRHTTGGVLSWLAHLDRSTRPLTRPVPERVASGVRGCNSGPLRVGCDSPGCDPAGTRSDHGAGDPSRCEPGHVRTTRFTVRAT